MARYDTHTVGVPFGDELSAGRQSYVVTLLDAHESRRLVVGQLPQPFGRHRGSRKREYKAQNRRCNVKSDAPHDGT